MSRRPPPFWIVSSSRPKSSRSPGAATACATLQRRPVRKRKNPAPTPSRKRNDEFIASCHGLQRHSEKSKTRSGTWPGPGRMQSLQSTDGRSEEHTSELQSHSDLVCRLLLE